ncbi:hypothetical protein ACO0QE_001388 [Hanseniaspora vineae]
MHIWPIFAPQTFELPQTFRKNSVAKPHENEDEAREENALALEDHQQVNIDGEAILETVTITDTNLIIFLTQSRILLYNAKPIAPVSVYQRSRESLSKFGPNKFMRYNNPHHRMNGLNDGIEISVYRNKIIIYVVTESSFLLVFHVNSSMNSFTVYKDYGIEPNLYNESFPSVEAWVNQILNEHISVEGNSLASAVADSIDTEVLTVFDQNNGTRVIQNGYIINKEKNFLQLMKSLMQIKEDFSEEMPIRMGDILLKKVLKFDHKIVDLFGLQGKPINNSMFNRQEHLCLLFENELHFLTLENYKLIKNEVIKLANSLRLVFNGSDLFVISTNDDARLKGSLSINVIKKPEKTVYTKEVKNSLPKESLLNVFNFGERYLILLFETEVVYFDTVKNEIYQTVKLHLNVLLRDQEDKVVTGGFLTNDLMLLITKKGEFQLYSKWGNLLTQINLFKLSDVEHEEYTGFSFIDNLIVLTTKNGVFQIMQCWKEIFNKSFTNFRALSQYVLFNSQTNDLLIYQPTNCKNSVKPARIIKLPTKFFNNSIGKVEINGDLSIMATYVSNKKVLLMTDLQKFSNWEIFSSLEIMDMNWLGSNYLICYMNDELENGGGKIIRCHDFNMVLEHSTTEKPNVRSLSDGKIWTYRINKGDTLLHWNSNTLFKYTVVRKKSTNEVLYKTGEINILLQDSDQNVRLETIDILSKTHYSKENQIQSFVKHTIDLSAMTQFKFFHIKWIYRYNLKGVLIYTNDDEIHKIFEVPATCDSDVPCFKSVKLLSKVERVVDILENNIVLVKDQRLLIFDLHDFELYTDTATEEDEDSKVASIVSNVISEEEYPIMISKNFSVFQSLQCFYQKGTNFQLQLHDGIILNQIVDSYLNSKKIDPLAITEKFCTSKYYMFALEKILSSKVVVKKNFADILELIDLYDSKCSEEGSKRNEKRLYIISNCLRKIEANRWSFLFDNSDITPKKLLSDCIQLNNGKLLGALLMVFLSYEDVESQSSTPIPIGTTETSEPDGVATKSTSKIDNNKTESIINGTLIKQVLDVLIENAVNSASAAAAAQEHWSMAFQLIRFLKIYDKENLTDFTKQALESIT